MTDTAGSPVEVGHEVKIDIRRDPNFAFLVADSVSVVQSNNAVELTLLSHRIGLDHQVFQVTSVENGIQTQSGGILSGPDFVHVGSVRVSRDGLLELLGLMVEHLRGVGYDEAKIQEKLSAAGG